MLLKNGLQLSITAALQFEIGRHVWRTVQQVVR